MQLHELKKVNNGKAKKRIGRGGKRGTMSGRGQKGQKSRAGRKMRPGMREFIIRLPKKKGITNPSLKGSVAVINVDTLEKRMVKDAVVDLASLRSAKLIRYEKYVKILGNGDIKKALKIDKNVKLSKTAKEKILAAGGTIG